MLKRAASEAPLGSAACGKEVVQEVGRCEDFIPSS